jgi:hypothetical protein
LLLSGRPATAALIPQCMAKLERSMLSPIHVARYEHTAVQAYPGARGVCDGQRYIGGKARCVEKCGKPRVFAFG